jgi:SnoaL-like domain
MWGELAFPPMTRPDPLQALSEQVANLTQRVSLLEDTNVVRSLHYEYGHYIDKYLYREAVDLFADTAEVRFLNGIYKGKAGARRLYVDWFGQYFTRLQRTDPRIPARPSDAAGHRGCCSRRPVGQGPFPVRVAG